MKFEIGAHSFIFMGAYFDTKSHFSMGSNSVVNQNCRLDNRGGLFIGRNVSISADVCILTADHDVDSADFRGRSKSVVIEDYVFVGTRATILPGCNIGRGAVVSAGALVTKDVSANTIVAGIPAKPVRLRNSSLQYQIDYGRFMF